jgi:hypothetical protein
MCSGPGLAFVCLHILLSSYCCCCLCWWGGGETLSFRRVELVIIFSLHLYLFRAYFSWSVSVCEVVSFSVRYYCIKRDDLQTAGRYF